MLLRLSPLARGIALGQVISILIATTGISSTYLAERGIDAPTAQSSLNYFLLAVVYVWYRRNRLGSAAAALRQTSVPHWKYVVLALIDVEANFLVVRAYQYTTITSIMLLDCWTIPVVMVLSRAFLKARFTRQQLAGVLGCLLGIGALVASDYLRAVADAPPSNGSDGGGGGSTVDQPFGDGSTRVVVGDLLCISAATLYAVSNVAQEHIVKSTDEGRYEFLAMLGVFGTAINGIQLVALERSQVSALVQTLTGGGGGESPWNALAVVSFFAFSISLFAMYSLTAQFLRQCDATLFNLSLLTSDAWAILAAVVLFRQSIHWLYFPALAGIVAGLVVYNRGAPPPAEGGGSAALADTAAAAAAAAAGVGDPAVLGVITIAVPDAGHKPWPPLPPGQSLASLASSPGAGVPGAGGPSEGGADQSAGGGSSSSSRGLLEGDRRRLLDALEVDASPVAPGLVGAAPSAAETGVASTTGGAPSGGAPGSDAAPLRGQQQRVSSYGAIP